MSARLLQSTAADRRLLSTISLPGVRRRLNGEWLAERSTWGNIIEQWSASTYVAEYTGVNLSSFTSSLELGLFWVVWRHLNRKVRSVRLRRQLPSKLPSGNHLSRIRLIRENDHPGKVFPGNVFPGKEPSGKVTIRETTVYRWECQYGLQKIR